MISSITGVVTSAKAGRCVIDVSGVGYLIFVPDHFSSAVAVSDVVTVHTSLIVREDSMALYGFATVEEQEIFDALLSVSGVGPRSALGILTEMKPGAIAAAIVNDDDAPFRKVSGIGPKTAKLITVQLSGRISQFALGAQAELVGPNSQPSELVTVVVEALIQLGWNERRAREVVSSFEPFSVDDTAQVVLKKALSELGGRSS